MRFHIECEYHLHPGTLEIYPSIGDLIGFLSRIEDYGKVLEIIFIKLSEDTYKGHAFMVRDGIDTSKEALFERMFLRDEEIEWKGIFLEEEFVLSTASSAVGVDKSEQKTLSLSEVLREKSKSRTRLIGLTGPSGCGKSEIRRYLRDNFAAQIKVIDIDRINRKIGLNAPDEVKQKLIDAFGSDFWSPAEGLNKELIFRSSETLERYNAIISEFRLSEILKTMQELLMDDSAVIIIDCAYIHQLGIGDLLDGIWCVFRQQEKREQGIFARHTGRSESETSIRMMLEVLDKFLPSDDEYRVMATALIDNNAALEDTFAQVDGLLSDIIPLEQREESINTQI